MMKFLICLVENKLFVKAKCEFHADTVSFLSFVIQGGRFKGNPEKVHAMEEWPWTTPDSKGGAALPGVHQFLSTLYLGHILMSSSVVFCWSPEAGNAFVKKKKLFTSAPLLFQPNTSKQFIVEADAFESVVSAIL